MDQSFNLFMSFRSKRPRLSCMGRRQEFPFPKEVLGCVLDFVTVNEAEALRRTSQAHVRAVHLATQGCQRSLRYARGAGGGRHHRFPPGSWLLDQLEHKGKGLCELDVSQDHVDQWRAVLALCPRLRKFCVQFVGHDRPKLLVWPPSCMPDLETLVLDPVEEETIFRPGTMFGLPPKLRHLVAPQMRLLDRAGQPLFTFQHLETLLVPCVSLPPEPMRHRLTTLQFMYTRKWSVTDLIRGAPVLRHLAVHRPDDTCLSQVLNSQRAFYSLGFFRAHSVQNWAAFQTWRQADALRNLVVHDAEHLHNLTPWTHTHHLQRACFLQCPYLSISGVPASWSRLHTLCLSGVSDVDVNECLQSCPLIRSLEIGRASCRERV